MSTLYKSKYRTESARLQDWDYSSPGLYYITVCTKNRIHYFGEIIRAENNDPRTILSQIGTAAEKCWLRIPRHFPFVRLDEYVIMPNHIHGIIEITTVDNTVETQNLASLHNRFNKLI